MVREVQVADVGDCVSSTAIPATYDTDAEQFDRVTFKEETRVVSTTYRTLRLSSR